MHFTSIFNVRFALMAGSLLSFTGMPVLAADAGPDPELYFYPSQGWSVEQNGTSCSISSRFNNGFLMRFNGGEKWISSMSVDFRQDVFQAGKSYDISLSVPGVQDKDVIAAGASKQALSVNLRRHKDFYKALRASSVLDMRIEENEFRFYLTGFDKSAGEFERCMAGAVLPKVSEAAEQEQDFTVNEAIAMEEQTKSAMVDTTAAAAQPVVNQIPYTETVKVGDNVVQESATTPATGILDTDVAEIADAGKAAQSQKRLSEQLAEDINNTPQIIEPAEKAQASLPSTRESLAMPPNMDDLPLVPLTDEREPEPIDALKAEDTAPAPVLDTSAPDVAGQEPAAIAETPVDAAPEAPQELTAEDLNRQMLERAKARQAIAPADPQPVPQEAEPVKVADVELEESVQEEIRQDAPLVPDPLPVEPVDPVAQDEAPVSDMEEVLEPLDVEPAPAVPPKPEPVKRKSPPIKVNKTIMTTEADFTDVEPAAAPDAMISQDMRKQIIDLERTVQTLKDENRALNNELKSALKESEDERMTIASENWNLEQATMRFNEAERQIKRLGQQLQRERAKHAEERRDLESMLFDPQVTDQAQLARLAKLEEQLMTAERELENQRLRYEERIRQLESLRK